MLAILLTVHSLVRWLILLTGVWAVVTAATGKNKPDPLPRAPFVAFMGSLHLQLLLGMGLFGMQGAGNVPTFPDAPRGSFPIEHLALGLIAAVLATIAARHTKAGSTDATKALAFSAGALVVVLLAVPWWRLAQ